MTRVSVCVKVQDTEAGKPVVYFAVVIDLQDSSSTAAAASASADPMIAWVISRRLQDFIALQQQLLHVL